MEDPALKMCPWDKFGIGQWHTDMIQKNRNPHPKLMDLDQIWSVDGSNANKHRPFKKKKKKIVHTI